MSRIVATLALLMLGAFASPSAVAATRSASIANYWFQDDATKDRKRIVVTIGDAITFTVVEGDVVPHTVEIDEFEVHSGALLQGQTFTTPKLTKAGTFRLYCATHSEQGHAASLVVEPKASKDTTSSETSDEQAASDAAGSSEGGRPNIVLAPSTVPPGATPLQLPALTIKPGATAPTGRSTNGDAGPFAAAATVGSDRSLTALWWLLGATVAMIAAGVLLLQRSVALRPPGTTPSTTDPPRSSGRSARSTRPKASESLRTSRGRKR